MRHALLLPLGLLLVGLLALLGAPRGPTDAEGDEPGVERGIVYEVFHGDSLHGLGRHEREIHLPGRGIAFTIENGRLVVFRPSVLRYATEDEPVVTWRSEDGVSLRMPAFHVPGTEPRRIGEISVSKTDADRLAALLDSQERLREVAAPYLRADAVRR